MRLVVSCPAKVNLFLAVGPKDARGYHPLRTVFQAVDLCDTLEIETGAERSEVTSDDPALPTDNTVAKALRLVAEVVSVPPLRVVLRKTIPAQSGLGGGSSDAAGLLRAVRALMGRGVTDRELREVALAVGADVPFFLVGGRARGEGYGERLTPLEDAPTEWLALAMPDVRCPTPEMYRRLDDLSYPWREFPEGDELSNDFERVAPCECLDLIERLDALGAKGAGLSGSGSAVFGRFSSQEEAETAVERLKGEGASWAYAARTLGRKESTDWG